MERRRFEEKMASFPKSEIWDERTRGAVNKVRAYIHRHPQPTISYIQNESVQDRPLKGPFHLVSDVLPAPIEEDVRQVLSDTIIDLRKIDFEMPDLAPVPVEWIGNSVEVEEKQQLPASKRSRMERLALDSRSDLVIFHVHGGAFLYVKASE